MLCGLDTKFCWSDEKPQVTNSVLSKLVGCPRVVGGSKKPSEAKLLLPSHAATVVFSSGCCSPVIPGAAFQTARRKRADGKSIRQLHLFSIRASWKLSSVTSAHNSLSRHVPHCHPSFTQGWPMGTLFWWGNVLKRIYTIVVCKLVGLGENRVSEYL